MHVLCRLVGKVCPPSPTPSKSATGTAYAYFSFFFQVHHTEHGCAKRRTLELIDLILFLKNIFPPKPQQKRGKNTL